MVNILQFRWEFTWDADSKCLKWQLLLNFRKTCDRQCFVITTLPVFKFHTIWTFNLDSTYHTIMVNIMEIKLLSFVFESNVRSCYCFYKIAKIQYDKPSMIFRFFSYQVLTGYFGLQCNHFNVLRLFRR